MAPGERTILSLPVPTVIVGLLEDIDPGAGARTDFGLKCRLYRSSEGISGLPPEQWIAAAIRRGCTRSQR